MCRLFGLHAGADPVAATFWLLDAPDSLRQQSHRNPDGAGIGVFGADGLPVVHKEPIAAWADTDFAAAAHECTGTTFVAHVRHASTGAHTLHNTHPFVEQGRLFAHNGVVAGLEVLDERLRELHADELVLGETDSERVFALITAETARRDGDAGAGIVAAISWVAANLPVYAVNLLLATATDLWALRYPQTNELWVLDRDAASGGDAASGADGAALDARTDRIHARSGELADRPAVVFASEPMDGETGWRLLAPGELAHVGADLVIDTSMPFPTAPAHPLALADLAPAAAASQH